MKNKKLILVALIFVVAATAAFAETGVGAAFGYNRFGAGNVALSLDMDEIPGSVQTVSLHFNSAGIGIGVTDDWYLIEDTFISAPFGWYFGLGFYANVGIYDEVYLGLGARAPIGLDVTLLKDQLVLYLEAAPVMGLGITPNFEFPEWDILGSFGFRFYF